MLGNHTREIRECYQQARTVCSKLRLDPKVRKQFLELTRRWLLLAHGYTAYWRGRAFEAAGQFDEMKGQYDPLSHRLLRPAGASSNWYERDCFASPRPPATTGGLAAICCAQQTCSMRLANSTWC